MGFDGFVISDYNGIDQIPRRLRRRRSRPAVNAGVRHGRWSRTTTGRSRRTLIGEVQAGRVAEAADRRRGVTRS